MEEQSDLSCLSGCAEDRDPRGLADESWADRNFGGGCAVSHERVGGASPRPRYFEDRLRTACETEPAERNPELSGVAHFDVGKGSRQVLAMSEDLKAKSNRGFVTKMLGCERGFKSHGLRRVNRCGQQAAADKDRR